MTQIDERESEGPPSVGSTADRSWWPVLTTAAVIALFALAAWSHRWVSDDGYIDLRIVHQVFAGHGPVYNIGERVEAGTSPLWLVLLILGRLLTFGAVDLGWIDVALGLGLTIAALWFGVAGARVAGSRTGRPATRYWPAGLLVVVALPPMWDFATSGLETSLCFAWIGACFWLVARRAAAPTAPRATRPVWLLVLIGLGTLVRPDLVVFSATFLAAHLIASERGAMTKVKAVAIAAAAPVVVEIARMGYYGSLVANTAIAKEASLPDWSRGWTYFLDLVKPYQLLLPALALVVLATTLPWTEWRDDRRWGRMAAVAAPVAGAAISAIYVIRVGGDFMHARMLLPALFAAVLPLFVWEPGRVGTRRQLLPVAAMGVLAVWAVVAVVHLRVPYEGNVDFATGIADEHGFYVTWSHESHPVSEADYRRSPLGRMGLRLRADAARHEDVLILPDGTTYRLPKGAGVQYVDPAIGVTGYLAGDDVRIIDPLGLADPYAAHLQLLHRGRPGHEKYLPLPWILARAGVDRADPAVAEATKALGCPPLVRLRRATSDPMDLGTFLANLGRAVGDTTMRIPGDPTRAVDRLC